MFAAESNIKNEIRDFLLKEFKRTKIRSKIISLILYGSMQTDTAKKGSDIDIAVVVVSRAADLNLVENAFLSEIAPRFKTYFGVQMDSYIKSAAEFKKRLKKNQPPVSTLMKSYSVLYGKEPLEI
jgi:predicted nucleotidyltransferase